MDKRLRRALINAISERTPTGAGRGQRSAPKSRRVGHDLGRRVAVEGASREVCEQLGIPPEWAERCEDSAHVGHDGIARRSRGAARSLAERRRVSEVRREDEPARFLRRRKPLRRVRGGGGGGQRSRSRHGESLRPAGRGVAFLSHCGSRGFGHQLAQGQFRALQQKFATWGLPLPGQDRELVYAPLGTPEADAYLDDMSLGANFATVNHLLINALVLEAFQEVIPGTTGQLVYFITHNIARQEVVDNQLAWVHRKGATRAFPAGHHALRDTPFAETGHPILLPGNPTAGSVVMVADPGAEKSCYSVNHGAGRPKGRKAAIRELDQKTVDREFVDADILTNCRSIRRTKRPRRTRTSTKCCAPWSWPAWPAPSPGCGRAS